MVFCGHWDIWTSIHLFYATSREIWNIPKWTLDALPLQVLDGHFLLVLELIGSLMLVNVWVLEQLIFCLTGLWISWWKTQTLPNLGLPTALFMFGLQFTFFQDQSWIGSLRLGNVWVWVLVVYESAEQKPKHGLTWNFVSAFFMIQDNCNRQEMFLWFSPISEPQRNIRKRCSRNSSCGLKSFTLQDNIQLVWYRKWSWFFAGMVFALYIFYFRKENGFAQPRFDLRNESDSEDEYEVYNKRCRLCWNQFLNYTNT